MFIELGCSHVATTAAILSLNTAVVLIWWALSAAGFSIDMQLYVVVGLSLLITFGLYNFLRHQKRHATRCMRLIRRLGYWLHFSRTRGFIWLQKVMDRI